MHPSDQPEPTTTSTNPDAGEPEPAASLETDHQQKLQAFRAALISQTPVAIVTVLLVLANVAVFVVMVAKGVSATSPDPAVLIDWGANFAPRTLAGEWWRLGASMFLHFGILHVGMNMLALWNLGGFIERMFGNAGFFLLYFLSGIAGSLASVAANAMTVSAGASGAIFGIAGAMLGGCWKLRKTMPREFLAAARSLGINVLVLFAIFTVVNQFQTMIDNTAHLAGFLTGLAGGWILAEPIPNPGRSRKGLRNLLVAVLGTAGCVLGFQMLPAAPTDVGALETRYQSVERRVLRRWESLDDRYEAGAISEKEYADELETQVLADWIELRKAFEAAENVPPAYKERKAKLFKVIQLREAGWNQQVEALREEDQFKHFDAQKKLAEASRLIEEMNKEAGDP